MNNISANVSVLYKGGSNLSKQVEIKYNGGSVMFTSYTK